MELNKKLFEYVFVLFVGLVVAQPLGTHSAVGQTPVRHLFQLYCASCHGPNGEGGRGPALAVPVLYRAPTRESLINVIKNGIPGTEMFGSDIEDSQASQIAAWVARLGKRPSERVFGSPKLGEQFYFKKGGCAECHAIKGEGGAFGPDLTDIGLRRGVRFLRTALTDPESDLPEGFLQVRAVKNGGEHITGVRLNEDTYSIQLRDMSGHIHSLFKSDLAELHKDRGKSPMPAYRDVFTKGELDDLVAFMASLRGQKK